MMVAVNGPDLLNGTIIIKEASGCSLKILLITKTDLTSAREDISLVEVSLSHHLIFLVAKNHWWITKQAFIQTKFPARLDLV